MDFELFYETKANLTKDQLRMMRNSGVTYIQPGIESLSSPILKLMRKGVTALQNIRLLKWCAELGIKASWNVIYGFPQEPVSDYERMADLVKSLTHLQPPDLVHLGVERFSPYHQRPEDFGLTACRPLRQYEFIYRFPHVNLEHLAYCFEYAHADHRDPETYVGSLRKAIDEWKTGHVDSSLTYSCGPGFCVINDNRTTLQACSYRLGETEARIYLACDSGTRPNAIWESLTKEDRAAFTPRQLERFLRELLEARLVYEEDGRFLSLAARSGGEMLISRERTQPVRVNDVAA
jgi:ribosomal peptide maturation radical SAM protein 1